jgi:hypothetical protein
MIIGHHAIAPETILSASYYPALDGGPGYRVVIERQGLADIVQWVGIEEDAKKLIEKAEKAIKEGEAIRAENAEALYGGDDE